MLKYGSDVVKPLYISEGNIIHLLLHKTESDKKLKMDKQCVVRGVGFDTPDYD